MNMFELGPSWQKILKDELEKPYMHALEAFVERERFAGAIVYPPRELVFNALRLVPYEAVKVVIMGQDPYHGPGQAHGLSFSVPEGIKQPPSLQNIMKELASDLQIPSPTHGCLLHWAKQGVLLLNATLTVRQSEPMSHHGKGWELFTAAIVEKLVQRNEPIVFILWGKNAQEKCLPIISQNKNGHQVLMAPHPSPFSAHQGFFGCRHFSKTNEILIKNNQFPIDWNIKN